MGILLKFFIGLVNIPGYSAQVLNVETENNQFHISKTKVSFSYQDHYLNKKWPIKSCNRKLFETYWRDLEYSILTYRAHPSYGSNFVKVIIDGVDTHLAANSPAGATILGVPKYIFYLSVQESALCKR